jgi:hypothetical protein
MVAPSKNTLHINDDGILEIHVIGDQTYQSVMDMGAETDRLLKVLAEQHKPGLILDDLTQMGLTDTAARQAVSKLARTLPFRKVAMLSKGGPLMRYGTKLLLQAIGMGAKIKYFEDHDAALRWLNE